MKHVLIMEDNMQLAFDWRDAFELNGHQVTVCHNAEDATAHLEQTKFDLVVTDMFVKKGKGGLHVIAKLTSMYEGAPPTIAVTGARSSDGDKKNKNLFLEQAMNLGVCATIEKPFPADKLIKEANSLWS